MRSLVLLCTLAAVVPLAARAQPDSETVRKLLSDQVKAWNRGDIDGFMKGYWNSDSTVFVSGGNLSRGYSQLLARYKQTYETREKMGKLEFTDLAIRTISSRAAIVTGVFRLYRSNDQPWGRFTLVVEKKAEGWRITHDHTSSGNCLENWLPPEVRAKRSGKHNRYCLCPARWMQSAADTVRL